MEQLYKIESRPDLVKDNSSKAILNTDLIKLQEYKRQKELYKLVDSLRSEVSSLKNELQELKGIICQFVK